jgi:hypothetical protein
LFCQVKLKYNVHFGGVCLVCQSKYVAEAVLIYGRITRNNMKMERMLNTARTLSRGSDAIIIALIKRSLAQMTYLLSTWPRVLGITVAEAIKLT